MQRNHHLGKGWLYESVERIQGVCHAGQCD